MKRILTAGEMSLADSFAIENIGIPTMVLMERAALAVVVDIIARDMDISNILIVCGTGNNGGDGAAVARLFAEKGIRSDIMLLGNPEKRSEQLRAQLEILKHYGADEVSDIEKGKYTLIIDAVFGIGLSRNVQGDAALIIEKINKEAAVKVAVDIASGIDADTGRILGCAVKADLTVTFARGKTGHYIYPGCEYSGEVIVCEIGIPVDEHLGKSNIHLIEKSDFKAIPVRSEYGNKGTFGKLLVIAGSKNICGAAFFAACAALKCGIGMVRIFTGAENRSALSTLLPEALIDTYDEENIDFDLLDKGLKWADAAVIGPGIGTGCAAGSILERFCEVNTLPTVMDADALNLLSLNPGLWEKVKFRSIITPHIGEMSRLTGLSAKEIKAAPLDVAAAFAKNHNTVCVLKDAKTVTAYPDGGCYINTSGCSALAAAGSGDVLAGILGGFVTGYKDVDIPIEAMGVYYHGILGERAAEKCTKEAATASSLLYVMEKSEIREI